MAILLDLLNKDLINRANEWNIDIFRFQNYFSKIEGIQIENNTVTFQKDKCYMWTGACKSNQKGAQHGVFKINETQEMNAHRIIYILAYGIPLDIVNILDPCPCGAISKKGTTKGNSKTYKSCCRPEVRHLCMDITGKDSNGRCVNPLHMKIGIKIENQHDIRRHRTGRGKIQIGNNHPNVKVNEDVVKAFWDDFKTNETFTTLKQMSEKYNISYTTAKDIKRGRTWTHVTGLDPTEHYETRKQKSTQGFEDKLRKLCKYDE